MPQQNAADAPRNIEAENHEWPYDHEVLADDLLSNRRVEAVDPPSSRNGEEACSKKHRGVEIHFLPNVTDEPRRKLARGVR